MSCVLYATDSADSTRHVAYGDELITMSGVQCVVKVAVMQLPAGGVQGGGGPAHK